MTNQETVDAINNLTQSIGAQSQFTQVVFIVMLALIAVIGLIGLGIFIARNTGKRIVTEGEIRKIQTQGEIAADQREDTRFDKTLSALVDLASEFSGYTRQLGNILEGLKAAQQSTLGAANAAIGGIGTLQSDVTQIKGHTEAIGEILETLREVKSKIAEVKVAVDAFFPAQTNPSQHIQTALSEVETVEKAAVAEQKRTTADLQPVLVLPDNPA